MPNELRCDRPFIYFHGYRICSNGEIYSKTGVLMKTFLKPRRGGGQDVCIKLYYNKKYWHWRVHRLVAACFLGPIDGYEINHKDRNTLNNKANNLERVYPSCNQKHWRQSDASY